MSRQLTSKSVYFGLIGTIGLLVAGLIGGAYLANGVLGGQAKKLTDAHTQSQALATQQQQLARTKSDIQKYQNLAAIAKGVVPQDKDQAVTVREIVTIAEKNGVPLGAITFPSSTLGGATPSTATTGTSSSSTSPSAGKGISQLKPATGLTGVFTMPITVQSATNSSVAYGRFLTFLSALEKDRRTALVSAITLQPDPQTPGNVGFTLNIDEYIKP